MTGTRKAPDEVYLDHTATSPLRPEALEAMRPWLDGPTGNPSSVHSSGVRARAALDDARARVAATVGARPEEIVFTSGGTEANNLAVLGAARAGAVRHIVTSSIEHPSVSRAVEFLEAGGCTVDRIDPDDDGVVRSANFLSAISDSIEKDRPVLATLQWINHETGAMHDVGRIAASARRGPFHVDAAQAIGRVPIDLRRTPIDLLTWTAHKIGGPVGIGALFRRADTPLQALSYGGSQEHDLRAGTPSVALAVGFAVAMELSTRDRETFEAAHRRHRERVVAFVNERFADATIVARDGAHPSTVCLAFPNVDREALLVHLDLDGVRVSSGAACASGTPGPSPVLRAMRLDERRAAGAIRVSFGPSTSDDHVARFLAALERAIDRARCG
ncbi:MAG: cysteine desulfurase family protein [Planctomycetota bacterium JB042]